MRGVWLGVACGLALWGVTERALACDAARPTQPATSFYPYEEGVTVQSASSPGGHFRVWYAESGVHAPPGAGAGVPPNVELVLDIAEEAREHFIGLGLLTPPSDQRAPCAAHDEAFDIYLRDFAGNADGLVVREDCSAATPTVCSGFMVVENDFAGYSYPDSLTAYRTVVPHEYFHMVQSAYDARLEVWYSEGTAQWGANHVYPELTDLERFLPAYFSQIHRSIDSPPSGPVVSFSYATAIFPVFLEERFDAALVVSTLGELGAAGVPATSAIDRALQARGADLGTVFGEFARWNAATGSRAGEQGYQDRAVYPQVPITPVTELGEHSGTIIGLSARYYDLAVEAQVLVETDPARNSAWYVPYAGAGLDLTSAQELPNGNYSAPLERGVIVITGRTVLRSDARYRLLVAEPTSPDGGAAGAGGASGAGGGAGASGAAGAGGAALAGSGGAGSGAEPSGGGCAISAGSWGRSRDSRGISWGLSALLGLVGLGLWVRRPRKSTAAYRN